MYILNFEVPSGQPVANSSPAPGMLPVASVANRMTTSGQMSTGVINPQLQQQMFTHQPVNLTDYLLAGLGSPPGATSPTQPNNAPLISNSLKM